MLSMTSSTVVGMRMHLLPTYIAGTRHHNEPLVRCFVALFLGIPLQRGSRKVHSWIGAIRIDVVVSRVFAHLERGSRTEKEGPESD